MRRIIINWRADGDGNAEIAFDGKQQPMLNGIIERLVTVPQSNYAPSDNYDIALDNDAGVDRLDGHGWNRSSTQRQVIYPVNTHGYGYGRIIINEPVCLRVENAGVDAGGIVCFYVVT